MESYRKKVLCRNFRKSTLFWVAFSMIQDSCGWALSKSVTNLPFFVLMMFSKWLAKNFKGSRLPSSWILSFLAIVARTTEPVAGYSMNREYCSRPKLLHNARRDSGTTREVKSFGCRKSLRQFGTR